MIFVDTSFWVALRNRKDKHHKEAFNLLQARGNETLVTTNHVRGESWTYLRRKAGHQSAVDFLDSVEQSPRIDVSVVAPELEDAALRWLRRHDEREYSFVDATSFVFMKSRKIDETFAFDGDFAAAGFTEVRLGRQSRRVELERIAGRPSVDELVQRIRERGPIDLGVPSQDLVRELRETGE